MMRLPLLSTVSLIALSAALPNNAWADCQQNVLTVTCDNNPTTDSNGFASADDNLDIDVTHDAANNFLLINNGHAFDLSGNNGAIDISTGATVSAANSAIVATQSITINNDGTIAGGIGNAVEALGQLQLLNRGTISGHVLTGTGNDMVTNGNTATFGYTIIGDIDLAMGIIFSAMEGRLLAT